MPLVWPARQPGFDVVDTKLPPDQLENVKPLTVPALRRSDWPVSTATGMSVPLPPVAALMEPESMIFDGPPPLHVALLKRVQCMFSAVLGPTVLTRTVPSVKVVDAVPDCAPVAVTS